MPAPTLTEMIGQMLLFGFRGARERDLDGIKKQIRDHHLGGVWLTDNNSPPGRTTGNIASPEQLRELCRSLQAEARIPLFIAIDAEGGRVIRLKEQYGFPATVSARYLGERDDPALTERHYRAIAQNLKSLGINFNLAPVADLNLRPDNPALGGKERCFSADPARVTAHARAAIRAHRASGVLTCLKHYPGHGSAGGDSHLGMVDISDSWSPDELEPYATLIGDGYDEAVLVAHVIDRAVDARHPASLSAVHIRENLQKKLGFRGLVVSDDLNMGAIKKYYDHREMLALAIEAGTDLLVHSNLRPHDPGLIGRTVADIVSLVGAGRIPVERLRRSYDKIIICKKRLMPRAF